MSDLTIQAKRLYMKHYFLLTNDHNYYMMDMITDEEIERDYKALKETGDDK